MTPSASPSFAPSWTPSGKFSLACNPLETRCFALTNSYCAIIQSQSLTHSIHLTFLYTLTKTINFAFHSSIGFTYHPNIQKSNSFPYKPPNYLAFILTVTQTISRPFCHAIIVTISKSFLRPYSS